MARYVYAFLAFATVFGIIVASRMEIDSPSPERAWNSAEFGGVWLRLEYATTTAAREKGLGDRNILAPEDAMLFVFPQDDFYGFWMKDTLVPLDIFWLNAQGHVVYIAPDVATSSYPNVFYPSVPARYVLETNASFARVHHIAPGTSLMLNNFPNVSQ